MSEPLSAISILETDVRSYGLDIKSDEWHRLSTKFTPVHFTKKQVIFSQAAVCDKLLFVAGGIVASEQNHPDGNALIARFFSLGDLCSNITSAVSESHANDTLVAITNVQGVLIPFKYFIEEYETGGTMGIYFRKKILETLLFDKDILCTKTLLDCEYRYQILKQRQPEVLRSVPDKHIARFMGITPQGFSRFLRNKKAHVNQG